VSQKIYRGGMIGAGAWSRVQLNAWAGVTNADIVALTDRHPDRRTPIVEEYKIEQAFDDFEQMLDEAELDFVDICTRPYSHAALSKMAVDRGIPVLCQKPFCRDIPEAQEVVEYCHQAGVRLMINENFRWQVWYRQIKEILNSGILGDIFFAKFHQRNRLTMPRFDHDQGYFTEMEQLLLYEVGTHLLDVSRFIFGEPETVYARLHQISPDVVGEDVYALTLGYPDMSVIIHDSWASVPIPEMDRPDFERPYHPRLAEIDGTKGTLVLKADASIDLYTDDDHKHWPIADQGMVESHIAAQQHFIDCLESGEEFETSGEDTIKTMALVYGCYRSAQEGRVVNPREML